MVGCGNCAGYSDGCGDGCAYGSGDYVDYSGECSGSCSSFSSSCGGRAHVVVFSDHVLLCLEMGYRATNLQSMCSATGDKFMVFTDYAWKVVFTITV